MQFAVVLQLFIVYTSLYQLLNGQLTDHELSTIFDNFYWYSNTTSTPIGLEVWGGVSHEIVSKSYFNTENSQMAFIGAIFNSTYHTQQLNPQPKLPATDVIYSWLSACPGKMEPFKDYPSTHGYLTRIRNKPQQKQPGQLSAPILV